MRTIGRHRPRSSPMGDFVTMCDYCSTAYYRSQLRRDRSGLLACKDDFGGDVVSISEANAAGARQRPIYLNPIDGGNYDFLDNPLPLNPYIQGTDFGVNAVLPVNGTTPVVQHGSGGGILILGVPSVSADGLLTCTGPNPGGNPKGVATYSWTYGTRSGSGTTSFVTQTLAGTGLSVAFMGGGYVKNVFYTWSAGAAYSLRVRESATSSFTAISFAGLSIPKTTLRDQLNTAFSANGLSLVASLEGNRLRITSGATLYVEIASQANGSTINTSLGFPVLGAVSDGPPSTAPYPPAA